MSFFWWTNHVNETVSGWTQTSLTFLSIYLTYQTTYSLHWYIICDKNKQYICLTFSLACAKNVCQLVCFHCPRGCYMSWLGIIHGIPVIVLFYLYDALRVCLLQRPWKLISVYAFFSLYSSRRFEVVGAQIEKSWWHVFMYCNQDLAIFKSCDS